MSHTDSTAKSHTNPLPYHAGAEAATVYQTAKKAGLTTLVAAIDAANFKGAFNDAHLKTTVFAPTNEAFATLIGALNTTAADLLKNKALLRTVGGFEKKMT